MRITMKAARINVGLSQKEAAKRLNIGLRTLQNWENGASAPRADKMVDICAVYGCSIGDIIFLPSNCGLPAN